MPERLKKLIREYFLPVYDDKELQEKVARLVGTAMSSGYR